MPQLDRLLGLIDRRPRIKDTRGRNRGPATHVIILDGTMSSLAPGAETNAGLTYKLLREMRGTVNLTLYYEAGIQWRDWKGTLDVMMGRGINRQIERAYGVLASRYHPGDRIMLIGYSRGAYAVRSLAGVVDMVGLVRAEEATVRTIRTAYRHYRLGARSKTVEVFRGLFCHPEVEIEAVGVWDTVKALGLRLPIVWRWAEAAHSFHNHNLGRQTRNGFHALALHETREAFAPVMWTTDPDNPCRVEQVWFRGTHGDIGGQLSGVEAARPLANIPLVWLLDRLESCGLPLPPDWRHHFPQDAEAPAVGSWLGWGKLFLSRRHRIIGTDPTERLHETVEIRGRWLQRLANRESRILAHPPPQAMPGGQFEGL
jgi:uncharacterized protein (DUF2235 family)